MVKFPYRGVVLTVYGGASYKRAETIKEAENKALDQYNELEKAGYPVAKVFVSDTKGNLIKDLTIMRNNALRQNPAPKRKTSARTQSAAESYVRRKSQATGKSSTKRLVNRRIKNLQAPEGVFPNPSVRNKKFIFVKKAFVNSPNRFSCVAYFHDTPEGNKNAIEYAKAYHRQNPEFIIKVETGTM